MNTATVAVSKSKYFRRGLLDGLTDPFKAFTPKRVTASFDNSILENSYIGKSADMANIRSDFEKALHRVQREANRAPASETTNIG